MSTLDPSIHGVLAGLSDKRAVEKNQSFSTGVVSLDQALGGRLPSGTTEVYGESSVGKTTLLYTMIAAAQREGGCVALCPSEYLDIPYMRLLGIDLTRLILITGNCGEDVLMAADDFLKEHRNRKCMLAFDSGTNLRPRIEAGGLWLEMWNRWLEILNESLGYGSSIVMVNQIRVKRSVHPNKFFAGGTDSTAKKVIDQFSARIELDRAEVTETNYQMNVNIVASTFSIPASVFQLFVKKGWGIDVLRDLVEVAVLKGIIQVDGAWYKVPELDGTHTFLCQGKEETVRILEDEHDTVEALLQRVRAGG